MTQSYSQIQKKIETLQRQADKLKEKEVHGVVARIKVAIAHYGLSAEQLGLGSGSAAVKTRRARKAASPSAAKYSDGQGGSWSGRGPRPHWLRDALNAGRKIEEFLTDAASSLSSVGTAKSKRSAGKKRPSKVLYRDEAGHSWSGRGPRPGWLKDALASGKTLEELKR